MKRRTSRPTLLVILAGDVEGFECVKGSGPAQMSHMLLPVILRLVPKGTGSLQQSPKIHSQHVPYHCN